MAPGFITLSGKVTPITGFNEMRLESINMRRAELSNRIDLVIMRIDALLRNGCNASELPVHKATLEGLQKKILPDISNQRDFQTVEERITAYTRRVEHQERLAMNGGKALAEEIFR